LQIGFNPDATCVNPAPGCLDVTLVDYAYDKSGNQIPAGDTGVPEPSTFVLTGVAALALGAKGLRAWRLARNGASQDVMPIASSTRKWRTTNRVE
jgi:hypothetical protein